MRTVRRARGFTLIELMVVVAIIGLLSSIAIPGFQKMTIRSKAAERRTIVMTIRRACVDWAATSDGMPSGKTELVGPENPPWPPNALKRVPDFGIPDWNVVVGSGGQRQIEGALYYTYTFSLTPAAAGAGSLDLAVTASGDLDGDAIYSTRLAVWHLDAGRWFSEPDTDQVPARWLDQEVDEAAF